jgi:hypothetical protein
MSYAVAENGASLAGLTNTVDSVGNTALIAGAGYTTLNLAPNYPVSNPGSYSVPVTYSGDSSFSPSSATANFTVSKLIPSGSFTAPFSYIASDASPAHGSDGRRGSTARRPPLDRRPPRQVAQRLRTRHREIERRNDGALFRVEIATT